LNKNSTKFCICCKISKELKNHLTYLTHSQRRTLDCLIISDVPLYSIFIHFALLKKTKNEEYFEIMMRNCATLKKFSDHNPIYFKCRYLLGEAIVKTLSDENPFFILEDAIEESQEQFFMDWGNGVSTCCRFQSGIFKIQRIFHPSHSTSVQKVEKYGS
jgi:hypothetical protein